MGMSLPGCAAIPAPYRERGQMAYFTGRRLVEMLEEDLKLSDSMTTDAFHNAIAVCSAIGGSTNAPPHLQAIAHYLPSVQLSIDDWQTHGEHIPLLVNCQPAGEYLGEEFYRAGGVPAVMGELLRAGEVAGDTMTVTGQTATGNYGQSHSVNPQVISSFAQPFMKRAGFAVMKGNLFDSAIMKKSVIDQQFTDTYLSDSENPYCCRARAVVFDGPEAAVGGGLALLQSGDIIEVNLEQHTVNLQIDDEALEQRLAQCQKLITTDQPPWQEIYRSRVNQLADGAVLETEGSHHKIHQTQGIPRNSH